MNQEEAEEIGSKLEETFITPLSSNIQLQRIQDFQNPKEELVIALYDYNGVEDGDLSFSQNETIKVLNKEDSGWWKGTLKGNVGIFPSNLFYLIFRQLCQEPSNINKKRILKGKILKE